MSPACRRNPVLARSLYLESLLQRHALGDKLGLVSSLEELAHLTLEQGMAAHSARLWGASERLREEAVIPIPDVAAHNRNVTQARQMLAESDFPYRVGGRESALSGGGAKSGSERDRKPLNARAAPA